MSLHFVDNYPNVWLIELVKNERRFVLISDRWRSRQNIYLKLWTLFINLKAFFFCLRVIDCDHMANNAKIQSTLVENEFYARHTHETSLLIDT